LIAIKAKNMNFENIFENAIDIAAFNFIPFLPNFEKSDLEILLTNQISSYAYIEPDFNSQEADLNMMINDLRMSRVRLGLTQTEMSNSITALCGRKVSQTTVCRFEGKILTKRNMTKLRPTFEHWIFIADVNPELAKASSVSIRKPRRSHNYSH
jgi:hypothetical protein